MAKTVSDFLLERIREWGVQRIYGYPGDGISGIMGALDRADNRPRFVQSRHEEMAAFMAAAHGKFTGEVGVCLATSGPGAIHLLNGLYDAKMDHAPVLAIVGQSARMSMGGNFQQEVDLLSLFKDVAGEYVHVCNDASQIRHLVDRAMRIAKVERTVTCLILPKDVQELDYEDPPHKHGAIVSSVGVSTPRVLPNDRDLDRAAEILNQSERPAMLIGAGALGAGKEVVAVAEALGAGVAKALLGKAALPDDLPYVTGGIGLLGTKPSWDLMQECDSLLIVGSSFPYAEFLPKPGQARGIQIDLDGRMLGIRYATELNLIGDSAESLSALLPRLTPKKNESWRKTVAGNVRDWKKLLDDRANIEANPVNPEKLFRELSPRLPDHCILTADSGTSANWFGRDLDIRPGMMASLSGNLATMGAGVPYAIGAKFAFPERVVFSFMGDGAMQMNGNSELLTIAKYWREWADPRLLVFVLNNRDLNQVTWEERAMSGDPRFPVTQALPDFAYADYAQSIGLKGIRVTSAAAIVPAIDEALAASKPTVIDVWTDPDTPTLPPHITLEQAKMFASSLAKGDHAGFAQAIKQVVRGVLPHR
jgi:pyruvate dehydrogenase (quinone)